MVQGCRTVFFKTKNPTLGEYILEGLAMEDVGIFYGHLENFVAIWYILNISSFGMFFPRFGILHQEKSGIPAMAVIRETAAHTVSTWLGMKFSSHLRHPSQIPQDQCDQIGQIRPLSDCKLWALF
jgi:hypothetical protein